MTTIYYDTNLKQKAKGLRKTGTLGEKILWNCLKNSKINNQKFTRQKPIGHYIVDFFNFSHKLAIEIDGVSHNFKGDYDFKREEELKKLGIKILRFEEKEVVQNIDGVITSIRDWFGSEAQTPRLNGTPLRKGDE